jgi:TP901 family phage tail tape measure protein
MGDLVIRFGAVTAGFDKGVSRVRKHLATAGAAAARLGARFAAASASAAVGGARLLATSAASRAAGASMLLAAAGAKTLSIGFAGIVRTARVAGGAIAALAGGAKSLAVGLWSAASAAGGFIASLAPLTGGLAFVLLARSGEMFNQKMRQSLAIMGDVAEATKRKMREVAFGVAKATIFSASQAAEAYYFLASAGLKAEASIAALPSVAAFAQAGVFDLGEAVSLLTDALSALGMKSKDPQQNLANMIYLSDLLVKSNTLADANVRQFATALAGPFAGQLRAMQIPLTEGIALLNLMAERGQKGEEASTAAMVFLRDMPRAIGKNRAAFERYGITLTDVNRNLLSLPEIIQNTTKRLGKMSHVARAVAKDKLGMTRSLAVVIDKLNEGSHELRDFEKKLKAAGGTTKEVADKQMTPFQEGWAAFSATFTKVGSELMEWLGPKLGRAMSWVAKHWRKFQVTVQAVWAIVATGTQELGGLIRDVFTLTWDYVGGLMGPARGLLTYTLRRMVDTLDVMLGSVEGWSAGIKHLFKEVALAVERVWTNALHGMKSTFLDLVLVAGEQLSKLNTLIGDTLNSIGKQLEQRPGLKAFIGALTGQTAITGAFTAPTVVGDALDATTDAALAEQKRLDAKHEAYQRDWERRVAAERKQWADRKRELPRLSDKFGQKVGGDYWTPPMRPDVGEPKAAGAGGEVGLGGQPRYAAALQAGSSAAYSRILEASRDKQQKPLEDIKKTNAEIAKNTATAADVAKRAARTEPVVAVEIPGG